MSLFKSKSGIIQRGDKQVGTQCGYCPNVIHLHQEVGGLLHVKNSRPICACCRILTRSKFASKIKADKKHFNKDIVERRENHQIVADTVAEKIATASQKRVGGDSDKKKKLLKRLHQK